MATRYTHRPRTACCLQLQGGQWRFSVLEALRIRQHLFLFLEPPIFQENYPGRQTIRPSIYKLSTHRLLAIGRWASRAGSATTTSLSICYVTQDKSFSNNTVNSSPVTIPATHNPLAPSPILGKLE